LKWVFERSEPGAGSEGVNESAIGILPKPESIDTAGADINRADLDTILSVDADGWKAAVPQIREHYAQFGDRLPASLSVSLDTLEARLD